MNLNFEKTMPNKTYTTFEIYPEALRIKGLKTRTPPYDGCNVQHH